MVASSRIAVEVDGDQVTFVELSGDLAVSSVSVNAGTLRDSLQTVLKGFRQRRNDPPVAVALVAPGFRFERVDVTSDDVEDPSRVLERLDPSETSWVSLAMPEGVEPGAVGSAFALAVPSDLAETVAEAFGAVRHEVFVAAACMPVDGVFVGLHMSAATLTVVSSGRPVVVKELSSGGLGRVAAAVSPGDVQAGLVMVSEALGGEGSVVVSAELSRHLRGVLREVGREVAALMESGRIPSSGLPLCPFGAGAQETLVREAAEEVGLEVVVPQQVSEALVYLPLRRRLPALGAVGAVVSPPRPLLPSGSSYAATGTGPGGPQRRLLPAFLLVAAMAAALLSGSAFHDAVSRTESVRAELERFPATVRAAQEVGLLASRPGAPAWMVSVAALPASRVSGLGVVELSFGAEGPVRVVLEATPPSGLSRLDAAVATLRRTPGVVAVEVVSVTGEGGRTLVELELEVDR